MRLVVSWILKGSTHADTGESHEQQQRQLQLCTGSKRPHEAMEGANSKATAISRDNVLFHGSYGEKHKCCCVLI